MPMTSEPSVAPVPPGTASDCGGGAGEPATDGVGLGTTAAAPAGAETASAPSAIAIAKRVMSALSGAEVAQRSGTRTWLLVLTDLAPQSGLANLAWTSVAFRLSSG